MHTPRQSVKETYRVRSTYLYRDIIPNIGGSDFELTLINLSELHYVFLLSILTKKRVAFKLVRCVSD